MAISAAKLLPAAGQTGKGGALVVASKKVVDAKKVFADRIKEKKKEIVVKRKDEENKDRKLREDKLEKKKEAKKVDKKNLLPSTGLFDTVKTFIGYTFLGYMFGKHSESLKEMDRLLPVLKDGINVASDVLISTIDFTASFIKGAYDLNDQISQGLESSLGPEFRRGYDKFMEGVKDFTNSALTLGVFSAGDYKEEPVPTKSSGGLVGDKRYKGKVTRRIRVNRDKPVIITQPRKSEPGLDIGGKPVVEKLFSNPEDLKKRNPLRSLMNSAKALKKIGGLGPIMGAGVDVAMGQKPSAKLYENFANQIIALVRSNEGMDIETVMKAYAQSLKYKTQSRVDAIFSEINNEIAKGAARTQAYSPSIRPSQGVKTRVISQMNILKAAYGKIGGLGVVANLIRISELDPGFEDPSRKRYGIAGWPEETWEKIQEFAIRKGQDPSTLEAQIGMVIDSTPIELRKQLLTSKDSEEAAEIFYNGYKMGDYLYQRKKIGDFNPDNPHMQKIRRIVSGLGGQSFAYRPPTPIEGLTVTGVFGEQRGPFRTHKGVDIAAPLGSEVRALTDGEVIDSGFDKDGWGNFLVFKEKDGGNVHLYAHLRDNARLTTVKRGDVIGIVGMTGRTSGPHLHWETGTAWDGYKLLGHIDPLSKYAIDAPFATGRSKFDTVKPEDYLKLPPQMMSSAAPPPGLTIPTAPYQTPYQANPLRASAQIPDLAQYPSYADGKSTIFLLDRYIREPASGEDNINFPQSIDLAYSTPPLRSKIG